MTVFWHKIRIRYVLLNLVLLQLCFFFGWIFISSWYYTDLHAIHACTTAPKIVEGPTAWQAVIVSEDCGNLDMANVYRVQLVNKQSGARQNVIIYRPFDLAHDDEDGGGIGTSPPRVAWADQDHLTVTTGPVWSIETQVSDVDGLHVTYDVPSPVLSAEAQSAGEGSSSDLR